MIYSNKNTVQAWAGPSRIDGAPIVLLVCGLKDDSVNDKTGAMIQTYVLRADMSPMDALKAGADVSICGGCVHRPKKVEFGKIRGRSCYVNLGQGPRSIWMSWNSGNVEPVTPQEASRRIGGRPVRLGSYGDPAAVPASVWAELLEGVSSWTGYTHQAGSSKFRDILQWCQVSADILGDAQAAKDSGVGSFRVLAEGEQPAPWETLCPSLKGVQCSDCGACSGFSGANIAIPSHGIGAKNFKPSEIRRRAISLPVLNPSRVAAVA
jgi:hypothetical protein